MVGANIDGLPSSGDIRTYRKKQCGVATSVGGDSTVHQEQVIWSATGAAKATLCFSNSILAVDFP
jgi:hypothetical protein